MRRLDVPFVDVDTSIERAEHLTQSGRAKEWREEALRLIYEAGMMGRTWKELSVMTGLHHGQISGILSKLHEEGMIFARRMKRQGCHPYCSAKISGSLDDGERIDAPVKTKARIMKERLEEAEVHAALIGSILSRPPHLPSWDDPDLRRLVSQLVFEILRERDE
jgi:hypothetical protein